MKGLIRNSVAAAACIVAFLGATEADAKPTGIKMAGIDQCVDIPNGNFSKGVQPILWKCHSGVNQKFDYTGGQFSVMNGALCLDIEEGKTQGTTRVLLWECHNGPNQRWVVKDGQLQSILPTPDKVPVCLDSEKQGKETKLVARKCNGRGTQRWQTK
ncbi:RICIN domain-containing protein [Pyxidicoccus caerfyrddinensis]|uniref:RICIN domain-containing protein n=1 Tax=Pyxidicoccus caerfyrddinensis TaxID=2709663 RepID=UPI0013DB6A18|nr:RICIN domain-containing protein [Pyxidicoccus caerfyrddinensis]